jgi:VanZ family protein
VTIRSETPTRPPYLWAALMLAIVLAIYIATLAPTTAFWDTSEYIASAYVLGIPHPPGNPLFNVLAHVFGAIPTASSYAVRINLFAAVTSAISASLWFLVAERWLRSIVPVRGARLATAAAGTLVGALAWTIWNQSTVNEKVYTLSLLSVSLSLWLIVRWGDMVGGPQRDRMLILIAYVIALSSTNHMMGVLVAPTIAVYVLWTDWREAIRPWVLLMAWGLFLGVSGAWTRVGPSTAGVVVILVTAALLAYAFFRDPGDFRRSPLYLALLAVIIGVSLNYFFLMIRAGHFPAINEGEPTTWQALLDVLERRQYGKPSVLDRSADFVSQLQNYGQYFSWQFAGDCSRGFTPSCNWFGGVATLLFTLLGLGGLVALWGRDKEAAAGATVMMLTFTIGLVYYLNFKYGYSIHPGETLAREVRERDYFFVASFQAWGLMVALGLGALMRIVTTFLRDQASEARRWVIASPILLVALIPAYFNRITASRAHETLPRDVAIDMLQSVEPYGILVTAGDNDTFPLWYAQEVEGIRRDVTLANLSLANTEWHLRQLRRRETPDFEPAKAATIWQGRTWPKPTNPIFTLTEQELDAIPLYSPTPATGSARFGTVELTFGDDYLEKADVATALLIRDNLGKRPIYFSWSDGPYPDEKLGLTAYLVTQGIVRRLEPIPVVPNDSIIMSRGFGYLDYRRSHELLWNEYRYDAAARRRPRGWVDPPSSPMLRLYRLLYSIMGQAYLTQADTVRAVRADSVARAIEWNLRNGN